MKVIRKRGIEIAFFIFWFLLAYIIAALVWWFISLASQVDTLSAYKEQQLRFTIDSVSRKQAFQHELNKIRTEQKRDKTKFIAEGVTFMLVIFVGAFFVYRSVRKQLRMQQQQQNFMMAITHELKTPIAVARLNLETMQKYNLDQEKQKKLLRMTLEETE